MTFQLVTPPAVEPVTLSDAKAFLRVGTGHEDDLILKLIASSRQRVEAEIGRSMVTRVYREVLDRWDIPGRIADDGRLFRLPLPPLISVNSITIYNAADAGAVWDAANYFVDTASDPGRIAVRSGRFPKPGRAVAGIEILFEAGHGASAEDVPEALGEAVLRLTADAYLNRDGQGERPLPMAVQSLLAPYKRVRL
jgi:uncharacterized phiE125 gp8 family phage protein